jgi:hypothetical protein
MAKVKEFAVRAYPIEIHEHGFKTVIGVGTGVAGTLTATLLATTTDELEAALTEFAAGLPMPESDSEWHNPNGYSVHLKSTDGRWPAGFKAKFENGRKFDKRTAEATV